MHSAQPVTVLGSEMTAAGKRSTATKDLLYLDCQPLPSHSCARYIPTLHSTLITMEAFRLQKKYPEVSRDEMFDLVNRFK